MASLFDGIFGSTNALPLAALFSQDSKFRASQFSQQVVASGGKYVQEEAVSTASPEAQPSSKAKKASKKRKHSTLPSAEPAEAVQITEPATDKISDSAVKAANRKKTAVSAAQKPAKASSAQQEVPNNAAKKSKHKKSKTMAEAMINAGQPEIDMPATTLLQKQKKAQKAKMNSSTGQSERTVSTEAAAETRALQSVQQTLPQAAADAQATMQVKCHATQPYLLPLNKLEFVKLLSKLDRTVLCINTHWCACRGSRQRNKLSGSGALCLWGIFQQACRGKHYARNSASKFCRPQVAAYAMHVHVVLTRSSRLIKHCTVTF